MSAPVLTFDPQLLLKAQGKTGEGIRLVIFDVDGVLTDGRLYYTAEGEAIKAFHVLDGQGFLMLKKAGIAFVVITGRDSPAIRSRLSDLGVERAFYGVKDKLKVAQEVLSDLAISWDDVAVIGDDWPDIPLFQHAAFAVAPCNAHAEAKALAHYVSEKRGGEGVVRELCDMVLMANGHYARFYAELAK